MWERRCEHNPGPKKIAAITMFSFKDKMKAIELLPKFDGSYSDVIMALGYPSRSSLINWHKEYVKWGYIHNEHKQKSKFSEEEKQIAITHYLETGRNISRTARMLGYPNRETLRSWILDISPPIRQQAQKRVHWTKEERCPSATHTSRISGERGSRKDG